MKNTLCQASLLLLFTGASAFAAPMFAVGANGNLSFSALFENLGGGNLQITLTNTGTVSPSDDTGTIGALFFSLTGDPVLTPVSLSLASGSTVVNGAGAPGPNWQYLAGLTTAPGGATQGLSAVGYGIFGSRGNFCAGKNCGNLLQGEDWSLVDNAYTPGSGNGSINDRPLVQDSLVFVLSGIPSGFDPSTSVFDVSAQFSTSLTGPNVPDPPSVPEPATQLLIGAGLISLGVSGKLRGRIRSLQSRNR